MSSEKTHHYQASVQWTGNKGVGTTQYQAYDRDHTISIAGKSEILASSDPAFRGDASKYNPEELLLASLAGCHMLWYLHLCAQAGVVVTAYTDQASGKMLETANGGGHFTEVTLQPKVVVLAATMIQKAHDLHQRANELCFIANSVNFPVHHLPSITSQS